MAIIRWVLVLVTGVIATISILSYAGVLGRGGSAASGQLYYCPMHPSVVQDHPGECPICSMTLVQRPQGNVTTSGTMKPMTAADRADGSTAAASPLAPIDLSPERVQLIGLRTAGVKREALGGELRTVGTVAASERGLSQITTRFAGWIQKLTVSATGERVRRGQVLASVYSPEVLRAEQELLIAGSWNAAAPGDGKPARDSLDVTNGLAANARRRLELLGISALEIDDVLRSGKVADAIAIRSPVDGYVVAKNAVTGVAIQPGTVLFELADLSTVWVTAEVYELDVSRIDVGQRARFELGSYPGEIHTGKVQFIHPVLDPTNRTLKVRLEFKNRSDRNGPRLRPGMYGTVTLDLPGTTGLMIPADAVVDTGEMQYVFVAKQGGRFEPRTVKLGAHARDKVAILSGVVDGETVVTNGNFLIDSESRLRAAIEGQTTPKP
jgi:Cu(I)/Ag(I) efflux system membrane fusion protein